MSNIGPTGPSRPSKNTTSNAPLEESPKATQVESKGGMLKTVGSTFLTAAKIIFFPITLAYYAIRWVIHTLTKGEVRSFVDQLNKGLHGKIPMETQKQLEDLCKRLPLESFENVKSTFTDLISGVQNKYPTTKDAKKELEPIFQKALSAYEEATSEVGEDAKILQDLAFLIIPQGYFLDLPIIEDAIGQFISNDTGEGRPLERVRFDVRSARLDCDWGLHYQVIEQPENSMELVIKVSESGGGVRTIHQSIPEKWKNNKTNCLKLLYDTIRDSKSFDKTYAPLNFPPGQQNQYRTDINTLMEEFENKITNAIRSLSNPVFQTKSPKTLDELKTAINEDTIYERSDGTLSLLPIESAFDRYATIPPSTFKKIAQSIKELQEELVSSTSSEKSQTLEVDDKPFTITISKVKNEIYQNLLLDLTFEWDKIKHKTTYKYQDSDIKGGPEDSRQNRAKCLQMFCVNQLPQELLMLLAKSVKEGAV